MISQGMRNALTGHRRNLIWLFWFEGGGSDLYAWSGTHTLPYDGQSWVGVGGIVGMSSLNRGDALAWREAQFTLPGLDPQVLAEIDEDVNGRDGRVWMGAMNDEGQVVPDPLLIAEYTQDTLDWKLEGQTVSLTLNCYEALPRFDQPTGKKWSHESQQEKFSGDTGFYYTQKISRNGPAIDWRPPS